MFINAFVACLILNILIYYYYFFFLVFKRCSLWKFAQTVHDLKGFFSAVTTIFPWRGPVIENETSIMLLNTPYTKRWITIASTIWCTLYTVYLFCLKKILFTVLLKLKPLSLETKWVINITTFVFSCLQVIDISNMLNMLKKDWKHRNLHHTWIHSRSLQVFNKNKKSAQPVELQMVQ